MVYRGGDDRTSREISDTPLHERIRYTYSRSQQGVLLLYRTGIYVYVCVWVCHGCLYTARCICTVYYVAVLRYTANLCTWTTVPYSSIQYTGIHLYGQPLYWATSFLYKIQILVKIGDFMKINVLKTTDFLPDLWC